MAEKSGLAKHHAFLCVDRDKLTGGIQISIDDATSGYRIAGPKYCGMSERIKRHVLTERDVDEIRGYLRRTMAVIRKTKTTGAKP